MATGSGPTRTRTFGAQVAAGRLKLKKLRAGIGQLRVRPGDSGPSASAETARVSVVVPVFNAMPELPRLLTVGRRVQSSLFAQTRTDVPRSMSPARRRRWVTAHAAFAEAHVPAQLDAQLGFPFRQRSHLVRNRDVQGLLRLADTEAADTA